MEVETPLKILIFRLANELKFGDRVQLYLKLGLAHVKSDSDWVLKGVHPTLGEMLVLGGCTDLSAMGRKQISRVQSGLIKLQSVAYR